MMTVVAVLLYLVMVTNAQSFCDVEVTSELICGDTRIRGFRDAVDKDFVLGGLFPVHSGPDCKNLRQQRGLERLEAMLFAIDRINNDTSLLPSLTIGYDMRDTCSEETIGIDEALDMIVRSGSLTVDTDTFIEYVRAGNLSTRMSGIVGAAASSVTIPIATLLGLQLFQLPLVSYASSSSALSNKMLYEYFLRTTPPDILQASAIIDLISHFRWEYVNVIFNDNTYGVPGTDAFRKGAKEHNICIDYDQGIVQREISRSIEFNQAIKETVNDLLNSTASVVLAFTDEATIMALFEELRERNSTRQFVWIATDAWANSGVVRDNFLDMAKGTFGFQPHTEHVKEFADYFSQLTPSTNFRNPFFPEYHEFLCYENGTNCPDGDVTSHPSYSQGNIVPLIIDAVYVFAHALQNFLDYNCDKPFFWDRRTQRCGGMKNDLNGKNLLGYIFNVTFNGIQRRNVSFDEDGDPLSGVYEIVHLQVNENGRGEYVSVGTWDSLDSNGSLRLNSSNHYDVSYSRCSNPCMEGRIRRITNPNCASCFECIPCVGPTYANSSNDNNTDCDICPNNHWGNNPLSGSTHCVPVEVRHLDFSSGWSITSVCIASITLIILGVITAIFVFTWKSPVVKSSGREQMVMLLTGIGICCILTFVIVSPPSTAVCVFQRIGVWFCFSLMFGALLVKIIRVARIFYSIKSSIKRPPFIDPKHQVMFTAIIVAGQLILVVIGLGVDPPLVNRDPSEVITNFGQQTGDAPVIIETCQQPHAAILVLSLIYNAAIIIGCIILGLMTRRFPENFNEARHVMFTSFTLVVVWVLFAPLYLYTEHEFQTGVLALGVVLSAIALMMGVFFPRIFIIVFQREKNTKEYVSQQNHAANIGKSPSKNFSAAFQRNVSMDSMRTPSFPLPKDDKSLGKGNSTTDSGVVTLGIKLNTVEGKKYQLESDV